MGNILNAPITSSNQLLISTGAVPANAQFVNEIAHDAITGAVFTADSATITDTRSTADGFMLSPSGAIGTTNSGFYTMICGVPVDKNGAIVITNGIFMLYQSGFPLTSLPSLSVGTIVPIRADTTLVSADNTYYTADYSI